MFESTWKGQRWILHKTEAEDGQDMNVQFLNMHIFQVKLSTEKLCRESLF